MEQKLNRNTERLPYVKPEAKMLTLCVNENIAISHNDEEFNGEAEDFD